MEKAVNYVLGVAQIPMWNKFVLLKKNRPPQLAGIWNFVGGKVEPTDETIYDAMVREFYEETGVMTSQGKVWNYIGNFRRDNRFNVYVFHAVDASFWNVVTATDEEVRIVDIFDDNNMIDYDGGFAPNVEWITQFVMSPDHKEFDTKFDVVYNGWYEGVN